MDHFVTYRYIVLTLYKAACWRLLVGAGTSKNCKKLPKMGILDPDIYPDSTLFEPFLSKIFKIISNGWFMKGFAPVCLDGPAKPRPDSPLIMIPIKFITYNLWSTASELEILGTRKISQMFIYEKDATKN